jgi:hypothetical protein
MAYCRYLRVRYRTREFLAKLRGNAAERLLCATWLWQLN